MYASHDSFTYGKPRRWYQWLLQPFSKTQNLTIEQQIAEGVRCFDLRVRFGKNGQLIACHGLSEYKVNVFTEILRIEKAGCYYRIVLENVLGARKTSDDDLLKLRLSFNTPEHPQCIYVTEKKNWFGTPNPFCTLKWKEWNHFKDFSGYKFLPVPRLFVRRYLADKFAHSCNLDQQNIHYYDFVEIK